MTNDPMEAHVIGFAMWVEAVKKAGTTDPDKVIDAIVGVEVPNLTGGISAMMPNHHITKPVLIGEMQRRRPVRRRRGRPRASCWSPASGRRYLTDSKDLIADWRKPMNCGNFNVVTNKCGGKRQVGLDITNSQGGATFESPRSHLRVNSQPCLLLRPLGGAAVGAGLAVDRRRGLGRRSAGPRRQSHHRRFRRSRGGDQARWRRRAMTRRARSSRRLAAGQLYVRKSDNLVRHRQDRRQPARARPRRSPASRRGSATEADLDRVRVNNRLRGTIEAAVGSLTLMSPDPQVPPRAPPTPSSSAAMPRRWRPSTRRWPPRKDPRIKRSMSEARAAIVLARPMLDASAEARGHRPGARARRPRCARRPAGDRASCLGRRGQGGGRRRGRRRSPDACRLGGGAERLVRHLARLGAAAGGDRARHHLRHHGRDQHGAWRDGDAGRLHDLRACRRSSAPRRRICSTPRC